MHAPLGSTQTLASHARRRVMLSLTVPLCHAEALRRTIHGACRIDSMRLQVIAHGQLVRCCCAVAAEAVQPVMLAVMRALPSAEFGRYRVLTS